MRNILRVFLCLVFVGCSLTSKALCEELNYPLGIADLPQLIGTTIDLESVKNVPLYLFVGADDENEMPFNSQQLEQLAQLFGETRQELFKKSEEVYNAIGMNSQFVVYPGIGHAINNDMLTDVREFFDLYNTPDVQPAQNYQVTKITPDQSNRDFHWPYYLLIPSNPTATETYLLVRPNNTGYCDSDPAVHDAAAADAVTWYQSWYVGTQLNTPVLVPAFPRPCSLVYTHALNEYALATEQEDIERIDLQLLEMIEDAQTRLSAQGISIADKVFMWGFSASANFTNRFSILHPECIRAAAAGGVSWVTPPISYWPLGSEPQEMALQPLYYLLLGRD